jgi:hypothetical protein
MFWLCLSVVVAQRFSGYLIELCIGLLHGTGEQIQDALHRAAFDCNAQVNTIFQVLQTKESPPTFHEVNKFTSAFQEIVSAYG